MPDIRLHLSDETAASVDEARGKIPRVVWIREAIDLHLSDTAPVRADRPTTGGNVSSDRVVTDLAPPPKGPAPGAKGCQHLDAKRRMGILFCPKCGRVDE